MNQSCLFFTRCLRIKECLIDNLSTGRGISGFTRGFNSRVIMISCWKGILAYVLHAMINPYPHLFVKTKRKSDWNWLPSIVVRFKSIDPFKSCDGITGILLIPCTVTTLIPRNQNLICFFLSFTLTCKQICGRFQSFILIVFAIQYFLSRIYSLTQLHVASANGYLSVVDFLLKHDVSTDIPDNDQWQPVHAAACWGHVSQSQSFWFIELEFQVHFDFNFVSLNFLSIFWESFVMKMSSSFQSLFRDEWSG